MKPYNKKLIVLRGNSGCGKSTAAVKIREATEHKIAIFGQDHFRRFILNERHAEGSVNADLLAMNIEFALARNYDVVLEGILSFSRYADMLNNLMSLSQESYFYYFDVSLEETLKRHATKPVGLEFGEEEMRSWYKPGDVTGFPGEILIPESATLEEAVVHIVATSGL